MTIADTCFLVDLMKGDPAAEEMVRIHNPLKTTAISSASSVSKVSTASSATIARMKSDLRTWYRCLILATLTIPDTATITIAPSAASGKA